MKKIYFMLSFFFVFLMMFSIGQSVCIECEEDVNKTCVFYFYGKDCSSCKEIKPFISELESKYPDVHFHKLEIWYNETNRQLFFKFCDVYCTDEKLVPIVFIGDKFLVGVQSIRDNLETEITQCIELNCPCPEEKVSGAVIVPKTELTLPVIISAALIDSVNPCAFAVLIFMLTYLIALGIRRRTLFIGLGYIGMVFITYFLAGLGLFAAVETTGISLIFYRVAAGIAIFAGNKYRNVLPCHRTG